MTKYSKIKKSSFAILALSLILVALLAFGGTYAYFSASASGDGEATMGSLKLAVKLDGKAIATDSLNVTGKVVPNQQILDGTDITIDLTGTDINYYIRAIFDADVTPLATAAHATDCATDNASAYNPLTISALTGWVKVDGTGADEGKTFYYLGTGSAGSEVATKSTAASQTFQPTVAVNSTVGAGGCSYYMGATITLSLSVEVLQADYLSSTTDAGDAMTVAALHTAWAEKVG